MLSCLRSRKPTRLTFFFRFAHTNPVPFSRYSPPFSHDPPAPVDKPKHDPPNPPRAHKRGGRTRKGKKGPSPPPPPVYEISGLFAVHKPPGMTSAAAVSAVKHILGYKDSKVGHGGTLDKAAEGVLVIGVGNGCKMLGSYTSATKEYLAQMTLGVATDTYDADGIEFLHRPVDHVTMDSIQSALEDFRGDIDQRPPPFSAVKKGGKRLSDVIRDGDRPSEEARPGPRPVAVYSLSAMDFRCSSHIKPRPVPLVLVNKLPPRQHDLPFSRERQQQESKQQGSKQQEQQQQQPQAQQQQQQRQQQQQQQQQPQQQHPIKQEPPPLQPSQTLQPLQEQQPITQEPQKSPIQLVPKRYMTSTKAEVFALQNDSLPVVTLQIACSAGFYVRALCHDLGLHLETCATMSGLLRTRVGKFSLKDALPFENLDKETIKIAIGNPECAFSETELAEAKRMARTHMALRNLPQAPIQLPPAEAGMPLFAPVNFDFAKYAPRTKKQKNAQRKKAKLMLRLAAKRRWEARLNGGRGKMKKGKKKKKAGPAKKLSNL